MGEIGNVIIKFEKQSLAKEWLTFVALAFGFYGTVEKAATVTGKYKWQLVFEKFDRDAFERMERKDLSKLPQQR